jgi:hypothetical protein
MPREQIDAVITRYADQETLYDQPFIDKTRVRITGPFTVEAVSAPTVKSLDEIEAPPLVRVPSLPPILRIGAAYVCQNVKDQITSGFL